MLAGRPNVYIETHLFRSYRGAKERNKGHFPLWVTQEGCVSAWHGLLPPFASEHCKGNGMRAKATDVFCGSMNLCHLSFFQQTLIKHLLSHSEYGLPTKAKCFKQCNLSMKGFFWEAK